MKTLKSIEKLGRQAWLAGLGVYGTGVKFATETFDQGYTKANALVNELISEGEKIEAELQEKLKAREVLDLKINQLKEKLGLNQSSEAEKLQQLTDKVDSLTQAVAQLVEKRLAVKALPVEALPVEAKEAAKPAAKKPTAKK